MVEEAEARLHAPEGRPAREYLLGARGLAEATVRRHRLGWTPGVMLPTSDGRRSWRAEGIVIPWFDGDRLARVKVRQPDGREPRYAQAFADRPGIYPGVEAIRLDRPLIAVEGEFDALLLAQELGGLASVITPGSAASRPDADARRAMRRCPRWFAAHDADDIGDKAALAWSRGATRVRPPAGKDWTDAHRAGIDLRLWWIEEHFPEAFDREERAAILEFDGGLTREAAEHAAGLRGA
jgi:hypothetical protein